MNNHPARSDYMSFRVYIFTDINSEHNHRKIEAASKDNAKVVFILKPAIKKWYKVSSPTALIMNNTTATNIIY